MSDLRVTVGVAGLAVRRAPGVLITLGLGSCVAIVLHEAGAGIGGLAHVLLPAPMGRGGDAPEGRFAATAVPALVREITALGGDPARIRARLVGGAAMFANLSAPGTVQVGERNVLASREALRQLNILVTGEAVGGDFGRNVEFNLADGTVRVTSHAHDTELL